jgi:plastocyanin
MWQKLPWLLIIIVIFILIVMGGLAVWLLRQDNAHMDDKLPDQTLLDKRAEKSCGLPSAESVAANQTVMVSGIGFKPAEVAIKVGQTVRWTNNGSDPHRIVVGPHPLHNKCIGLDSKKLEPESSFGFTFTKPGEWIVHDENQLSNQAKIIVTE